MRENPDRKSRERFSVNPDIALVQFLNIYSIFFIFKMFKRYNCTFSFTRKDNLHRHEKTHNGIRFPYTICTSTFSDKCHQNRHNMKNVHVFLNRLCLVLF